MLDGWSCRPEYCINLIFVKKVTTYLMWISCILDVRKNSSKIQGAACMFYPHVLEMIGEILKEDFYILPSSIHEGATRFAA